jgi:hypothetical protein
MCEVALNHPVYDPRMTTSLRLLCLMVSSFALAACGGGGSGQSDTETEAQKVDPRAGYFHAADSAKLNPPLAKHQAVWREYTQTLDACNKEVSRLLGAGAAPRAAVKCHFRGVGAIIKSVTAWRATVNELDGDYRAACDKQIKHFATTLDTLKAAWQRYRDDWTTFANTKAQPAGMQQHLDTAEKQGRQVVEDEIQALTRACYIESDIPK